MKQNNWLKLHRKILDSSCFNDPNPAVLKVWIYCLTTAKHREGKILRSGEEIIMKSGQFLFSRTSWAKTLQVPESTLRNIIEKLEKWDTIVAIRQDGNKPTIYQIRKWKDYQIEDTDVDSKEDTDRTLTGQQQDTYKNDKNVKNDKNNIGALPPMSEEVGNLWKLWEQEMAPITTKQVGNRNALVTLSRKYPVSLVGKMIRAAAAAQITPYTSKEVKCSSPSQLLIRWDDLYIWAKSQNHKHQSNQPI